MMNVALLHLDLICGPEKANQQKLLAAMTEAGKLGADWVVTPETALQGYYWSVDRGQSGLREQKADFLSPVSDLARQHRMTVFFCSAEYCKDTGKAFNTCVAISPEGDLLGRHRKVQGHGSAEAWATHGESRQAIPTSPLAAGVLICADSWYAEHAQAVHDDGAEVIVVPAAWPPGDYGPGDCWEKRSRETGLPVWVCNQTGTHPRLDFKTATSVVVQNGETALSYHGEEEAILLFQWDEQRKQLAKPDWSVVCLSEAQSL